MERIVVASAPNASLPIFYNDLVPLNSNEHGSYRVRGSDAAPFLAKQHAVPLTIDEFVSETRVRITEARAVLVVIDPDLAAFVEPAPDDPPFVALDELAADARERGSAGYRRPDDDVEALAVLQFTSGSTADPKGVMIPNRCMVANLDAIQVVTGIQPGQDVIVSWLPLYHDMGLIGALTLPMATGTDAVLAPPQDFLASPARWMQWMSDFGGTVTAGPNFSYAIATRALRRLKNLDLSPWRVALNGAEPIDPATVESFIEAAVPHGFDPEKYDSVERRVGVTYFTVLISRS